MSIRNALASVPVKDLESSIGWYERLFGRRPDSRPMHEVAEWKFACLLYTSPSPRDS